MKVTFNEVVEEMNSPHPTTEIESHGVTVRIYDTDTDRGRWGNQVEFILATIGFAVGLGNIWRFTYLCQKNGGGAFLILYFLSLFLLGIPLFFLELAIGHYLRQGSIRVWNIIQAYLGGVGVCMLVAAVYTLYNMVIAWCFYYLVALFQDPLPYSQCPRMENGSLLEECELAGNTQYYWYNNASVSPSIDEWHLALVLICAWAVVFLFMMKGGVKSAGKALNDGSPGMKMLEEIMESLKIKKEVKSLKDLFKCVICQEKCAASMYFCVTGCGQLIGCFLCASRIQHCPLCRVILPHVRLIKPLSVGGLAACVGVPEIPMRSALREANVPLEDEDDDDLR